MKQKKKSVGKYYMTKVTGDSHKTHDITQGSHMTTMGK